MSTKNSSRLPIENNGLILLTLILVGFAFATGTLWQKVNTLEKKVAGTSATADKIENPPPAKDVPPVKDTDKVRGDRNARLALIEYSDLECPFCKSFHPTARRIVDEYPGQVMWVYRHFPLDQIHSKADKEAEAVECAYELAGEKGFWALVDKIFEGTPGNNGLDLDSLPKLASETGLNEAAFTACLESGKYTQRVEEDYQSGITAGVTGTPGNFLLDTSTGKSIIIPGAVPYDQLKQSIDSLLSN